MDKRSLRLRKTLDDWKGWILAQRQDYRQNTVCFPCCLSNCRFSQQVLERHPGAPVYFGSISDEDMEKTLLSIMVSANSKYMQPPRGKFFGPAFHSAHRELLLETGAADQKQSQDEAEHTDELDERAVDTIDYLFPDDVLSVKLKEPCEDDTGSGEKQTRSKNSDTEPLLAKQQAALVSFIKLEDDLLIDESTTKSLAHSKAKKSDNPLFVYLEAAPKISIIPVGNSRPPARMIMYDLTIDS